MWSGRSGVTWRFARARSAYRGKGLSTERRLPAADDAAPALGRRAHRGQAVPSSVHAVRHKGSSLMAAAVINPTWPPSSSDMPRQPDPRSLCPGEHQSASCRHCAGGSTYYWRVTRVPRSSPSPSERLSQPMTNSLFANGPLGTGALASSSVLRSVRGLSGGELIAIRRVELLDQAIA